MNTHTPEASMSTKTDSVSDREIVNTRLFDAPRELVWSVFTEPKHLANWWGPRGFTSTVTEMDLTVGGVWLLTMRGPDGTVYPNKMVFTEIVKPERLVFDHGDGKTMLFQNSIRFEDVGGKTRVTLRALFPTAEACEHVKKNFRAEEGGRETLEKAAEYIATQI